MHDALADPEEARAHYGFELAGEIAGLSGFDAVIGAVAHDAYRGLGAADLARLLRKDGLVADIKGIWRGLALPDGLKRWAL